MDCNLLACFLIVPGLVLQVTSTSQPGTARAVPPPSTGSRINSGPNRCNGRCCPGWGIRPGTQLCIIPKCRTPCRYGYCMTPNLCRCFNGGFGSSCPRIAVNENTCYLSYNNGQCSSPAFRPVSKSQCCCGYPNRAYGKVCSQCPSKGSAAYRALGCPDDPDIPINPTDPTTDEGGKIPDGSKKDVTTDDDTGKFIDECKINRDLCEFGECVNIGGGDFRCKCRAGYRAVNNGKRCQAVETSDQCFLYDQGLCQTIKEGQFSKRRCCCEHPERAFGRCNQCPVKGTKEYWEMACDDDDTSDYGIGN